ncbi:MAG: response regulator transcription factor [Campylobacter sp.]|uniref:response regulator transcription factor n=1 Tax=Campylobacter sp. TaxID=205 RepID=UPI001B7BECDF|nr:response regulator transcription factor [Campylobacter sp.]MBP3675664.1 response regulator transcription factor [Campylobacter sp.]
MVYVLEDEKAILDLICYALKSQNIPVKGFGLASDFYKALKDETPQILVLDVMLPDADGFEILKNIKSNIRYKDICVLMLTALDSEINKVKGLDLGADDYIAKPFGVMEFLARIRVIFRRKAIKEQNSDIIFDGLEFSHKNHIVKINGVVLELTLKEFELLGFLLQNPNQVFSRDMLLEMVWGYGYDKESRTVDMHIKTLRKKLGNKSDIIRTIHGVGYKLIKD